MAELPHVQLRDGRLHIAAEIYDRHFAACPAVALLAREGRWWLLPLVGGAGGLQVKLRNARGDRVVESQEFFRAQGLEDTPIARDFSLLFDSIQGGYRLQPAPG